MWLALDHRTANGAEPGAGGWEVVGADKNGQLLQRLSSGETTFEEKGMPELFEKAAASGNLTFSQTCVSADVYIVAVPTPYMKTNKRIDQRYTDVYELPVRRTAVFCKGKGAALGFVFHRKAAAETKLAFYLVGLDQRGFRTLQQALPWRRTG